MTPAVFSRDAAFLFLKTELQLHINRPKVCIRTKWPVRPMLISTFCSMKRLGAFLLLPGWDASPSQGYPSALNSPASSHFYTWMERGTERLKNTTQCPGSSARTQSGGERTDHEASAPPQQIYKNVTQSKYINITEKNTGKVYPRPRQWCNPWGFRVCQCLNYININKHK